MIHQKLLQFQQMNIKVEKLGENPHFKSSYATLNEVLAKVKDPLNKLGVVIMQRPGIIANYANDQKQPAPVEFFKADGLTTGLITELVDTEDDTKISCFMPYVGADTAQKLGSANTYNRRYSLVTLLGLEDVDDDGNVASAPTVKKGKASSDVEYDPFN